MNDETTNLDQADEDILTPTVSDEALEAVDTESKYAATWGTWTAICSQC